MTKIIGMDPSLNHWGIAVMSYDPLLNVLELNQVDVIKTKPIKNSKLRKSIQDLNRAKTLIDGVYEYVKEADVVVVELPHGSQSAQSMKSYAICIALTAALTSLDIPFIYMTALDVKKVVGDKTASKESIISWVENKHPGILSKYKNSAEHQADATVVVYAALNQIRKLTI